MTLSGSSRRTSLFSAQTHSITWVAAAIAEVMTRFEDVYLYPDLMMQPCASGIYSRTSEKP